MWEPFRGIVGKSVFENIDELLNELKAEPEYKQYFWLLHYFCLLLPPLCSVWLPFRMKKGLAKASPFSMQFSLQRIKHIFWRSFDSRGRLQFLCRKAAEARTIEPFQPTRICDTTSIYLLGKVQSHSLIILQGAFTKGNRLLLRRSHRRQILKALQSEEKWL